MIVWKIVPRRTISTVIFANRPPGALAKVRAPTLPVCVARVRFFEALLFGVHIRLSLYYILLIYEPYGVAVGVAYHCDLAEAEASVGKHYRTSRNEIWGISLEKINKPAGDRARL